MKKFKNKALSKKDKAVAKKALAKATGRLMQEAATSSPKNIAPLLEAMLKAFERINRT